MLLEGILEKPVFEIHRAEVVAKLTFQLDGFGSLLRTLHQGQPLQELLGSLLGATLLAQFGTFFIESLRLFHALRWAVAGGQRDNCRD